MNAANDGGPAFPVPDLHPGAMQVGSNGMSLRDWFAGNALMGWAAGRNRPMEHEACEPASVARSCYAYADAMLRARERGQEGANDDAWALRSAVTIHQTISTELIHPTTWTARYWDSVRTLEESAPTIAAALRALRAKVEEGAQ